MVQEKRPLKVFLCHASGDKPPVRDLYKRLTVEGVDAWLDKEKLLPGQDWRLEIPKAVREADVVVVCLSNKSVTKEGYVQKEIKFALDIAEEKPEGTIFLIPARLEDCAVPDRLSRWQWVDLYEENGFVQLLRSLKLRADAVGATVEPTLYVDPDKETELRLDQLYTEGLAAFYTEDWDRACQRFQSILSERPSHKNAAEKLAEAERQRNLSRLYSQASEAVRSEDWGAAIKTLEELSQKSPEYRDAASLLRNARKQKQLRELYTEAGKLHAAQKWEAVVKVFEQIAVIEPNYPDPNGLLPSAQKEVAELKRLAELNRQYSQGVREMDAGNWIEARRLLETVHKSQTGFLETERLLRKVEDEILKMEEQTRRSEQVNVLYEQAHGLLRSNKWRNALNKMEEIRNLDDHFPDTDGIAEKAQTELAREEQEAERQNRLAALYAEAVRLLKEEKNQEALDKWQEVKAIDPQYPDRQWVGRTAKRKLAEMARPVQVKPQVKMPKSLWVGIVGIIVVGIVITSVIVWGNKGQNGSSTSVSSQVLTIVANLTETKSSYKTSTPRPATPISATVPTVGSFTKVALDETCPMYPSGTNFEGFISKSSDPMAPWSGTSVHFQGTNQCPNREKIGESSLIYRYRIEFNEVTKLTSIAVSGAAFGEPNGIFRVLDENKKVLGTVKTFGGNSFHTYLITLHDVEGKIFFIDEFDTSPSWRFRESIVVNGDTASGYSDPTMYDDFGGSGMDPNLWDADRGTTNIIVQDGYLGMKSNVLGAKRKADVNITEPYFVESRFQTAPSGGLVVYAWFQNGQAFCQTYEVNLRMYLACIVLIGDKNNIISDHIVVSQGVWNTVRIEIESSPLKFTFYVDGVQVGSYETEMMSSKVSFGLGSSCLDNGCYFDYIRIGAIEDDPSLLFFEDFDGPALDETYKEFPTNPSYDYRGKPNYSLETLDQSTVIRMRSSLQANQMRGLLVSKIFSPGPNPIRLEIRFNTLIQSRTRSIDGFMNVWLLDSDNSRFNWVGLAAWNYGSERTFAGKPFNFKDNTWYRLVITGSSDQEIRASIIDDETGKELIGVDLGYNLGMFKSGFKIGIMQQMGTPTPATDFPTDVAIDWIRLTTNATP